jgi:hypothetical protein
MAKAPLSRERQIELMQSVEERRRSRSAKWLGDPDIREALRRPAPGQDEGRSSQTDPARKDARKA